MDDGTGTGRVGGTHGGAPYRALALLAIAALLLPAGRAAAEAERLESGASRRFAVEVAGARDEFLVAVVAGCRYRLVAEPRTLARPVLEIGRPGEEPLERVQAAEAGQPAVHVWDAERDALLEVRVGGFSAQTGAGLLRFETLDPDGARAPDHRRFLVPGAERARVGELLVGERNVWDLVVEEGAAYEIAPTQGSAGRVVMVVLDWDLRPLADSSAGASSWIARPPVRFRVPAKGVPPEDARKRKDGRRVMQVEVRSALDGGGTYGLRMRRLGPDESVEPAQVTPPEAIGRGAVEGQPTTFRAGPGDVAFLYVPHSPDRTQVVLVQRGERWIQLEDMGLGGSARSQENALMVWFQPYYPGTYRFVGMPGPPPSEPRMILHDRAALGSAPIHMGTGVDPTARARLSAKWGLVGLGVCMPGWDYLFVCVHGPDSGIAMRVLDAEGKVVATRSAAARTISPGLGPSLRFEVPRPGVYRLEAKNARRRIVQPLLRRASN